MAESLSSSSSSSSSFGLKNLIPIINALQEVFSETGLDGINELQLPQIVVVGAQSSGKSSVLESLVGKSFLPRGSGLVTRCPAILQLIHTPRKVQNGGRGMENGIEPELVEWCVFQHRPEEVFNDFDKVRQEIEAETNRKAGTNSNIVKEPISLKVYSPKVVTLTVVDLPGIVKLRIGDQPMDIEQQINSLIMEYISNPNSLILAVSAANNDIATSESIKYALQVDPAGDRTLSVITKLDLMDRGTDASAVLRGDVINVKLGIIGVVNRSQEDIDNNKSVSDGLAYEKKYLKSNYSTLIAKNGTPYLARRLNELLLAHIGKCLPDLEMRISQQIQIYEAKLESLGGKQLSRDKSSIMVYLIGQFISNYQMAIDGSWKQLEIKHLCGGAHIRQLCQSILENSNIFDHLATSYPSNKEIATAIRNSKGFEANLDPQDAFIGLIKNQIKLIKKPTLDFANMILQELKEVVLGSISEDIQRYPKLHHKMVSIVNVMLSNSANVFKDKLITFIGKEAGYVDTDHADFIKGKEELAKKQKEREEGKIGGGEPFQITNVDVPNYDFGSGSDDDEQRQQRFERLFHVGGNKSDRLSSTTNKTIFPFKAKSKSNHEKSIEQLLSGLCETTKDWMKLYFGIVLKALKHEFRSSLAYYVIYYARDNLQSELITKLHTPENIEDLIQESEFHVKAREDATRMLQALIKATNIIEETRNATIT